MYRGGICLNMDNRRIKRKVHGCRKRIVGVTEEG